VAEINKKPLILVAVLGLSALLGTRVVLDQMALGGPPRGSGVIEGQRLQLSARVGGRITLRPVQEGQQVQAGDLLLQLDCVEPQAALREAEARRSAAQAQVEVARRAAHAAGAAAGAAQAVAQAGTAQAQALDAQAGAAARQVARLEEVARDTAPATLDQAQAQATGLSQQGAAARAQGRAAGAQAQAAQAQAQAAQAQVAAAEAQLSAVDAALVRAQLAVDECTVRAPRAGEIRLLPFEVGELASPGSTLASLVDLSTVEATFYLPNAELAAGVPGAPARLRADAWPERVFEGKILRVSSEAEFTPRNIQTRTDRDRLVYAVVVAVANPEGALRPGMPVEVELPQGASRDGAP
jgi:HlyD family secretion protein